MWIRLIVFVKPLKGNVSLNDTYLVVFGLFIPKLDQVGPVDNRPSTA